MSNTQTTTTFTTPPDDVYLLPALYDWHYTHSPDHPLFVFEDDNYESGRRVITWKEGLQAAHRASEYVRSAVAAANGNTPPVRRPVFAILSAGDTLPYFILLLGVLRAGYTVFPISPKLSAGVVAGLLKQEHVQATHLVLSGDEPTRETGRAVLALLAEAGVLDVEELAMPTFDALFPSLGPEPDFPFTPTDVSVLSHPTTLALPALILHSTGTTGTPKAVPWSAQQLAQGARVPPLGDVDLRGKVLGCHAVPMFAAMGSINLFAAPTRGMVLAFFRPRRGREAAGVSVCPRPPPSPPPPLPDPVNLMQAAVKCRCDYLLCVPAFLEMWARDAETVATMVQMSGFLWGGGPLAQDAGDALTRAGVKLYLTYGSTEAGLLCRYVDSTPGRDWQYFAFAPNRDVRFFPADDDDDDDGREGEGVVYEAAVVQSPAEAHDYTPCVVNASVDGKPAYLLPDLFLPHRDPDPRRRQNSKNVGLWRILGRADDTLVLSTGLKVHPAMMEGALVGAAEGRVRAACVFGAGRPFVGVLVEPALGECVGVDGDDEEAFVNAIWAAVERMNASAVTRVRRALVLVASRAKPFAYTLKGGVRRREVLALYSEEIAQAYREAEGRESEGVLRAIREPSGEAWGEEREVKRFVWKVVRETLRRDGLDMEDWEEKDLFAELGASSADATWLRGVLVRALSRAGHVEVAKRVPPTVVYANPTVGRLAAWLVRAVNGEPASDGEPEEEDEAEKRVHALVDRFAWDLPPSSQLPTPPSSPTSTETESTLNDDDDDDIGYPRSVLLTGATGALGSVLLAQLLASPEAETCRVYVFARHATPGDVHARHAAALERAGYDPHVLAAAVETRRVRFVVGDLAQPDLGLPQDLFEAMKRDVTAIVHCAWTVDFKRALSSFAGDVAGVRCLVDFALSSCSRSGAQKRKPPRLVFISSISVAHASTSALIPETHLLDVRLALGSGYAESKWAAEALLARAAATAAVPITVVRLTQLAGARRSGAWKREEWVPSLVQGSVALGCLPALPEWGGAVGWVDVESAAGCVLDAVCVPSSFSAKGAGKGKGAGLTFVHVAHPNPVRWATLVDAFAVRLGLGVVPYAVWLAALERAAEAEDAEDEAVGRNPALRLLAFFRERGNVHLAAAAAAAASSSEALVQANDVEETRKTAAAAVVEGNPNLALRLLAFVHKRARARLAAFYASSLCPVASSVASSVVADEDGDRDEKDEPTFEPIGMPRLALTRSLALLPTLRALAASGEQLGEADVQRWVGYWERNGALGGGGG